MYNIILVVDNRATRLVTARLTGRELEELMAAGLTNKRLGAKVLACAGLAANTLRTDRLAAARRSVPCLVTANLAINSIPTLWTYEDVLVIARKT